MELVIELLQTLVPALLIFFMAMIVMRGFLNRETDAVKGLLIRESESRKAELAMKNKDIVLPIRLQAYERMTLFCSRIELSQLLQRISGAQQMSATKLRLLLINSVEEEYNHNVTQQMYMTATLWNIIRIAKKEAIQIVNNVYNDLEVRASGKEFIEALLEYLKENPQQGHLQAQVGIKKEVAMLF